MKKKGRLILGIMLVIAALAGLFAIQVGAESVTLSANETIKYSGYNIEGRQAAIGGQNSSVSKHRVYFQLYSNGSNGEIQDASVWVGVGEACPVTYSSKYQDIRSFEMVLNPTGAYSNCEATGYYCITA